MNDMLLNMLWTTHWKLGSHPLIIFPHQHTARGKPDAVHHQSLVQSSCMQSTDMLKSVKRHQKAARPSSDFPAANKCQLHPLLAWFISLQRAS